MKGRCVICDRNDVTILGRGHCGSCYYVGKKNNWDNDKTKIFRLSNPIVRGRRAKSANAIKIKRKYTKRIDITTPKSLLPLKYGNFSEIIIRAFAAIEAKEKAMNLLCSEIKSLEQKLIMAKQDLIKSRYEVRQLMREKITSIETSGDIPD